MDKVISDFINSLVNKCLENPALAGKEKELEDYFYQQSIFILIDHLNEEQFSQIKDLDPNSQEAQAKIQLFASQIPGFIDILDEKLIADAEKISQTEQIPS